MRALIASMQRELAYLQRSPWDLALATWIPLILLIVVAWQLSSGVLRELPIAVVDDDHTSLSRDLIRKLDAAAGTSVVSQPDTLTSAWRLARSGQVYAVVHVPHGTARDVLRGRSATVLGWYNASYAAPGSATWRDLTNATQALNAEVMLRDSALMRGPHSVHAPPIRVQARLLYNAQGSYEPVLVLLMHPALLHLLLCLCVISALGRELRDGTAGEWLGQSEQRIGMAIVGKLLPYVLAFTAYAVVALLYMNTRGWPFAGSALVMLQGELLLMSAYAAAGLLFVGATRVMSQALSFAGLYAGASFAFTGAFFPTEGGPWIARIWSELLPFTHFGRLQTEQYVMGVSSVSSMPELVVLCAFVIVFATAGFILYRRAAHDPQTWGQR